MYFISCFYIVLSHSSDSLTEVKLWLISIGKQITALSLIPAAHWSCTFAFTIKKTQAVKNKS